MRTRDKKEKKSETESAFKKEKKKIEFKNDSKLNCTFISRINNRLSVLLTLCDHPWKH